MRQRVTRCDSGGGRVSLPSSLSFPLFPPLSLPTTTTTSSSVPVSALRLISDRCILNSNEAHRSAILHGKSATLGGGPLRLFCPGSVAFLPNAVSGSGKCAPSDACHNVVYIQQRNTHNAQHAPPSFAHEQRCAHSPTL